MPKPGAPSKSAKASSQAPLGSCKTCLLPLSVTGVCASCPAPGPDQVAPTAISQPGSPPTPADSVVPAWASAMTSAAADLALVAKAAMAFMERMPPANPGALPTLAPPGDPPRGRPGAKRPRERQQSSSDASASPPRLEAHSDGSPPREQMSEGELSDLDEIMERDPPPRLSAVVSELVSAVRDTFNLQEGSTPPTSQEFALFPPKKPETAVFPVHSEFTAVVSKAWDRPNQKFTSARRMDVLYPFPAASVEKWASPPKVDPPVARLAKNTALPVLDGSSLQDAVDRRLDSLSKSIFSLAGTSLRPAFASAWVARALSMWLQRHLQDLTDQHAPADTLDLILQMSQAAKFLCEASMDIGALFARISSLSILQRREIWLKVWDADASSKRSLANLPFDGSRLFGAQLDEFISTATGGKSTHLPQPRSRPPARPGSSGSRYRSFRRFSSTRPSSSSSAGGSRDSRRKPSFKPQPSWRPKAQSARPAAPKQSSA